MSVLVADAPATRELGELYGRYKALALATGAALVLDAHPGELAARAGELLSDCRAAAAVGDRVLAGQFAACVRAAQELDRLLARAVIDAASVTALDTERVRVTHRGLRREVWKVIPCEYVPCGAAHRHDQANER